MNTEIILEYTPWVKPEDHALEEPIRQRDAQLPTGVHLLGNHDFFAGKSLSELAREQGVGPIKDISLLAGGLPDDEDIDEMLEEIYRSREP